MAKYKNKYRIGSARRPGWDYTNAGSYFITICTDERQHFFGECKNGKMTLSVEGAIVQGFWFEIPKHFDHVELGEFIVMPNHVHGVLTLDASKSTVETRHRHVSNPSPEELKDKRKAPDFYRNITPKSGSISVIIGSYKAICKKIICQAFPELNFAWQERFHDHIIRDEKSFNHISNYIVTNAQNWKEDRFHGEP